MNTHKTAEELRDSAAVAVAKVRTEIHTAFKRGGAQGFSRSHVRDTLVRKGYRENDIAYVEQLMDGTAPHPKDPQRKVSVRIPIGVYLALAIIVLLIIAFGIYTLTAGQREADEALAAQTKAYEAQKLQNAQLAIQQLRSQQQSVAIVADQLLAYPSLSANLAENDRTTLLLGHAQELKNAAQNIDAQLTTLEQAVGELEQV